MVEKTERKTMREASFEAFKKGLEDLVEHCVDSVHQSTVLKSADLYRMGLALAALNQVEGAPPTVQNAYNNLLQNFPPAFRLQLFDQVDQALQTLIVTSTLTKDRNSEDAIQELVVALQAVAALYQASPLAGAPKETTESLVQSLVTQVYTKHTNQYVLEGTLVLIASLLLLGDHALFLVDHDTLLTAISTLQEDMYVWSDVTMYLDQNHSWWRERLTQSVDDAAQRDYLVSLLSTGKEDEDDAVTWDPPEEEKAVTTKVAPEPAPTAPPDPMQVLIDQVRAVLPDLGEGFCETALALYKNDVEHTVAALLLLDTPEAAKQLPTPLLADRSLPRRHRANTAQKALQEEQQAKQVAKVALRAVEKREQTQAMMLRQAMTAFKDEYNDDYDDQWDDTGDGIMGATAGADSGLYDDYQAVQTYNRVYREMEAEDQFWKDNINTNRQQQPSMGGKAKATENGGMRQYRGPDKLKGGRIPNQSQSRGQGRGRGRGGIGGGRDANQEQHQGDRPPPAKGNIKSDAPSSNSNDDISESQGFIRGGGGCGCGRGGGGGGGGGGGNGIPPRGRGRGGGSSAGKTNHAARGEGREERGPDDNSGRGRGGRAKERALAKRREQQKSAMYKRSG